MAFTAFVSLAPEHIPDIPTMSRCIYVRAYLRNPLNTYVGLDVHVEITPIQSVDGKFLCRFEIPQLDNHRIKSIGGLHRLVSGEVQLRLPKHLCGTDGVLHHIMPTNMNQFENGWGIWRTVEDASQFP